MTTLDFTLETRIASTENEKFTVYGFQFWPVANRSQSGSGELLEIFLAGEPETFCESYQLLADYKMTVLDGEKRPFASIFVQFEPITKNYSARSEIERWTLRVDWKEAEKCGCFTKGSDDARNDLSCTINCQFNVRELLTATIEDYTQESLPRRDFALLVGQQKQLYVDLQYLSDLGSEYFCDLLESKRKGVRRAVLMRTDPDEMELFLNAVCTHGKPVITNRNFDLVLRVSHEFSIDKVLRACESYLIETDSVHPIRKLEYAAEYDFGMLGETVVRQLNHAYPLTALETVHDYLLVNDERLDQMHPDILESLYIFDDFVVI